MSIKNLFKDDKKTTLQEWSDNDLVKLDSDLEPYRVEGKLTWPKIHQFLQDRGVLSKDSRPEGMIVELKSQDWTIKTNRHGEGYTYLLADSYRDLMNGINLLFTRRGKINEIKSLELQF